MQQIIPVYFPSPVGSQLSEQPETWFINMIGPAQRILVVASLDDAEYALLDSGSGLTSCPINYADDLPLLPRPDNLPTLINAARDSVECIGLRQVGYRFENGERFVVTWHVANVTNLTISTESVTGANIKVRHAKNESSMIIDRSGTRTNVVLHKFAKVLWLKLRRDDTVLNSGLKIAALSTQPIDSEEERQTRLKKEKKKKETLGMDETMDILKAYASSSSGAGAPPISFPRQVCSLSHQGLEARRRQRSTQRLILCCGVTSLQDCSN